MEREYFISVPLNQDSIEEYNYWQQNSKNIKVYTLKEKEFD